VTVFGAKRIRVVLDNIVAVDAIARGTNVEWTDVQDGLYGSCSRPSALLVTLVRNFVGMLLVTESR